ncbi:HdeD family acid-resistance protein [Streptomyces sp. NPDC056202]|uniref:HdeD family acid-resistance protein n=1 Tax=unclassified Streptomyces TaxID=2593676 RepID=UPI0035D960A6
MAMSQGSAPRAGPEDGTGTASTAPAADPEDQLARLGRSWIWLLCAAMATLIPGILALVWPDVTLHVLAVLIGVYLLLTGAFQFVTAFGRSNDRVPGLIVAVLCVLGGVLCLRNPLQTIAALSLIVGAVWLVSGIVTLYTAIATKNMPHRGVVMAVAALGIVAGIVVLALPTESARALTRLLGLWLVLLGLAETAVALAWRSALRRAGVTGHDSPGPT